MGSDKKKYATASATLILICSSLTGCAETTERQLTREHPIFSGLPIEVIDETISTPGISDQYKNTQDETIAEQMTQARAYDIIACRSAYQTYMTWRATGRPGKLEKLPVPQKRKTQGFITIDDENNKRIEMANSHDIEGFKESMIGQLKCGKEIPVNPKDHQGKTIEKALMETTSQEAR